MSVHDPRASGSRGRVGGQDCLDLASRDHYGRVAFHGPCANINNIYMNYNQFGRRLSERAA